MMPWRFFVAGNPHVTPGTPRHARQPHLRAPDPFVAPRPPPCRNGATRGGTPGGHREDIAFAAAFASASTRHLWRGHLVRHPQRTESDGGRAPAKWPRSRSGRSPPSTTGRRSIPGRSSRPSRTRAMGVWIPKEYGGHGGGVLDLASAWRSCRAPAGGWACSAVNALGTFPILVGGTEEQKQKYLRPIAEGKSPSPSASRRSSRGATPRACAPAPSRTATTTS